MPDPILGIPDPAQYGDTASLREGALLPYVVQLHEARRAGRHHDVRLGRDRMFSWATKKDLPEAGQSPIRLYQTPLHRESYMHFQGEIPEGYGRGRVTTADKGEALIREATPSKILFTLAHRRYPERYVAIKTGPRPTDWLLHNVTPKTMKDVLLKTPADKEHYRVIAPEKIEAQAAEPTVWSEKIDGARMLIKLKKHGIEALSYRTGAGGRPIMHTERLQLPHRIDIPKELVGTALVGEAFGEKEAAFIPVSPGVSIGTVIGSERARNLAHTLRTAGSRIKHPGILERIRSNAAAQLQGLYGRPAGIAVG